MGGPPGALSPSATGARLTAATKQIELRSIGISFHPYIRLSRVSVPPAGVAMPSSLRRHLPAEAAQSASGRGMARLSCDAPSRTTGVADAASPTAPTVSTPTAQRQTGRAFRPGGAFARPVGIAGSAVIACEPCFDADCAESRVFTFDRGRRRPGFDGGPPASSGPPAMGSRPAPWHPLEVPPMLGTLNVQIQAFQPG